MKKLVFPDHSATPFVIIIFYQNTTGNGKSQRKILTKIKKTIDFQVYFNATIFSTILRKRRFSAEKKGDFIMSVDVTKMPKLGFGMMRLPEKDGVLDLEQIC